MTDIDQKNPTHDADPPVVPLQEGENRTSSSGEPSAGMSTGEDGGFSMETLKRVCDRDQAALGEFFDFYFDALFGLAYRLTGDRVSAEDLIQDVFLRAYKAIDRLDPERDPAPWLITITYNSFRDRWRSAEGKRDRSSTSFEDAPHLHETLPSSSKSPEQSAINSEREELVQEAITALPVDLRAIVVMHDYLGLDHNKIATILVITHGAVRKRYSRALQKMADSLRGSMR